MKKNKTERKNNNASSNGQKMFKQNNNGKKWFEAQNKRKYQTVYTKQH